MQKLIRKLCKESRDRIKKLAQSSQAMNKIYIQFYGDKTKSADGKMSISKDVNGNQQLELIRKIITKIYEKEKERKKEKNPIQSLGQIEYPKKLDFDKLQWSEILRPYENIDFKKITKDELEIILREVLEISQCPIGKVYDTKKKRCTSVVHEGIFSIEGIFNTSIIPENKSDIEKTQNPNLKINGGDENNKASKNSNKKSIKNSEEPTGKMTFSISNQATDRDVIDLKKLKNKIKMKQMAGNLEMTISAKTENPKNLHNSQSEKIIENSQSIEENLKSEKSQEISNSDEKPDPTASVKEKNFSIGNNGISIENSTFSVEGMGDSNLSLNLNKGLVIERKGDQNAELNLSLKNGKIISKDDKMSLTLENNPIDSKEDTSKLSLNLDNNAMNLNTKSDLSMNLEKGASDLASSGMQIITDGVNGNKIDARSMEITTSFQPEIHYPDGSTGTVKLSPVAVTGTKDNMDMLMTKIVELTKNGKAKDIAALIEESPELRGKFKIKTEKDTVPHTTSKPITTIQIVDEGEIPIAKRENLEAKIEFDPSSFVTIKSSKPIEIQPEVKIIREKLPSKIILKATLPNGEIIHVGERNLTNDALLNGNATLTLDNLGIDLKSVNMSNVLRESLSKMKLDIKNEKPVEIKIQTKKIQPAKFVHNAPLSFGKRANAESTTAKIESSSTASSATEALKSSSSPTTTSSVELSTQKSTKLFSTIFKPMKDAMKKNTEKIQRLLGLNDEDQRRFIDIPASNKEDIDKIIKEKPAKMEFKSVLGKTLDDVGVKGIEKMMDEHESTTASGGMTTISQVTTTSK